VLHKKSNEEIYIKLGVGYDKNILCQRTVYTWTVCFRSRRISVEDDDRLGRQSRDDLSVAVSRYLERNPHASCHEIAENLFVPMTTISLILEEIGSRFFIAR
jgi:hypothetical protein